MNALAKAKICKFARTFMSDSSITSVSGWNKKRKDLKVALASNEEAQKIAIGEIDGCGLISKVLSKSTKNAT